MSKPPNTLESNASGSSPSTAVPQEEMQLLPPVQPPTWGTRAFLVYDIVMMLIIIINLLTILVDHLMFTNIGSFLANHIGQGLWLEHYRTHIHPIFRNMDEWFTVFLITELSIRWAIAIIFKHHRRWFFFPFIHWYEVLACIPSLRALRLLRAVMIGYRLYQLGYFVIPRSWIKRGKFYYEVVLEELSDRIVITIIDGIEKELNSTSQGTLVKNLIEHHRLMLADALAEVMQQNLAPALAQQRATITKGVGQVVTKAIADTPELHNILRLFPVVGNLLEQQIQSIGQRLGENISAGLLDTFAADNPPDSSANPAIQTTVNYIGDINLESEALEKLAESLLFESLEAIRQQVKIQQWKQNS